MGRNLILALTALAMLLSTVSLVSAQGSNLVVSPLEQKIHVGSTGTYELTLNTTYKGAASLSWDTDDAFVVAGINGLTLAQTGKFVFTSTGGKQTFTLEAKPLSGITVGEEHDVTISFSQGGSTTAKAAATAGVIPAPELSTVALMSAGMIGLFGLVRVQKRD
ncbi:Uncharacterised protein [uncultured archaeon]|nr:Uncharacterised protein [uncultured archaeon]